MNVIPQSFEEWKNCIEERCSIPLTLDFAIKRLAVYNNESLNETQRFMKLYGQDHLDHIRDWFSRIIREEEAKVKFK